MPKPALMLRVYSSCALIFCAGSITVCSICGSSSPSALIIALAIDWPAKPPFIRLWNRAAIPAMKFGSV